MKKLIYITIVCIFALTFSSCYTLQKSMVGSLPPQDELSQIFDSIIQEGYSLFFSERANWVATDLVFEKYDMDKIGSSISWQPNDTEWHVVFFDTDNENSLLECHLYINSNKIVAIDSVRPITNQEKELLQRKETMINEAFTEYGNDMTFAPQSFGNPNIDIVRINDKLTRVYFLQGTIKQNIIPFGNDYSVDFDENLTPIAFRRYHRSLIDCPTIDKGEEVIMTYHTHLPDNPYITPTDICNFLLYSTESMKEFGVLSTAYGYMFIFNKDQRQIVFENIR